jgi:hypothetical protein
LKRWNLRSTPRKKIRAIDFASSYICKRYYNQKKLEYKARTGRLRGKLLDSGFYEDQTYGALQKAWLAYIISCKHDDRDRRKYYAAVIQKLEGELGLKKYYFEEIKEMTADFLEEHQDDPNIHDMSLEEIEEIMRKSDSEFWQSVHGENS